MRLQLPAIVLSAVAATLLTLTAGTVYAAGQNNADQQQTSADKPYSGHIRCETDSAGRKHCKIDLWLTRGLRAFGTCQVCHGLDANGSSFAPSLLERLRVIDKAKFIDVVTNGLQGQLAGYTGVMPSWKNNPNIMDYINNLYAYLKARSDGAIPAGILPRYDEKVIQ